MWGIHFIKKKEMNLTEFLQKIGPETPLHTRLPSVLEIDGQEHTIHITRGYASRINVAKTGNPYLSNKILYIKEIKEDVPQFDGEVVSIRMPDRYGKSLVDQVTAMQESQYKGLPISEFHLHCPFCVARGANPYLLIPPSYMQVYGSEVQIVPSYRYVVYLGDNNLSFGPDGRLLQQKQQNPKLTLVVRGRIEGSISIPPKGQKIQIKPGSDLKDIYEATDADDLYEKMVFLSTINGVAEGKRPVIPASTKTNVGPVVLALHQAAQHVAEIRGEKFKSPRPVVTQEEYSGKKIYVVPGVIEFNDPPADDDFMNVN